LRQIRSIKRRLDKLTSLSRPLLNLLDISGHRSARPIKPDEMNPNRTGLQGLPMRISYSTEQEMLAR
jgi:hypothetical protein